MSIIPTDNKGTMNLPNPLPQYEVLPHQFKLTQLINDFSSIYGDTSLKYITKKEILEAQIEYIEAFMYALVKNLPNTEGVKSE